MFPLFLYGVLAVVTTFSILYMVGLLTYVTVKEHRQNAQAWDDIHKDLFSSQQTCELPAFPKDVHKTRLVPRAMPTIPIESARKLLGDLGR